MCESIGHRPLRGRCPKRRKRRKKQKKAEEKVIMSCDVEGFLGEGETKCFVAFA